MLQSLGIKPNLEYYACEDHFESEAMSNGKRRRWASDARLNATIEDIKVDRAVIESMKSEHSYAKANMTEECDCSLEAKDLNMGKESFCDSQTITCLEEIVDVIDSDQSSQVLYLSI